MEREEFNIAELNTITALLTDPNLKAYYRFESGALTTDTTPNTHTLSAISDPAETTGKFGGGVDFDSNDAYSATDGADFQPTSSFSLGAWIKTSSNDKMIFQSQASAGAQVAGVYLYLTSGGKVQFTSGKNTGISQGTDFQLINSTASVNDGNWHLCVGVWDGSTLKVYVDNNSADSVAWAVAPAYQGTNYVRLACENDTGSNSNFLTGQMDDAFFFKGTALTAQNVLDLYSTGVSGNPAFLLNFI